MAKDKGGWDGRNGWLTFGLVREACASQKDKL